MPGPVRATIEPRAEARRRIASAFDDASRERATREATRALRRLDAAELLFTERFRAESLRVLASALDDLLRVVEWTSRVETSSPAAFPPASLREEAEAARDALRATPDDDGAIGESEVALHGRGMRVARRLGRDLVSLFESERTWRRERAARVFVLVCAVAIVLFVAGSVFGYACRVRLTATASSHWANDLRYTPSRAIDGDPDTEWLGNDGRIEWLEVRLSRPTHVRAVRLLNSRNAPYFDRATRDFRLEFFSHGKLVRSREGRFARFEREPRWQELGVDVPSADAVRIVTVSHHGLGAGLAEVDLVVH